MATYTTGPGGYSATDDFTVLPYGEAIGPNIRAVYDGDGDPLDLVGELTDAENRDLVLARGGCNCATMKMPPCAACSNPLRSQEALAVLQARDEELREAAVKKAEMDQTFLALNELLDKAGYMPYLREEFDAAAPRALEGLVTRLHKEISDAEEAKAATERGERWGAW